MDRAKTMCFYGLTGTGKTSQLFHIAKWVYEKLGKITRVISQDPGGWESAQVKDFEKLGIIQAVNLNEPHFRKIALAAVRGLSDGLWPMPPKVVDGEATAAFRRTHQDEWPKIGAYFIEALHSIGEAWLQHIAIQRNPLNVDDKHEQGRIGSEGTVGMYKERGYTFGANSKGHYNLIQNELRSAVVSFGGLPVDYVFWTSHPGIGNERGNPVYCPQLVGDARNIYVPGWFGDCLHFESVRAKLVHGDQESIVKRIKAWFEDHSDPRTGEKYLAKSRVPPEEASKLVAVWPKDYILLSPERGINQYLDFLQSLGEEAAQNLSQWKSEVDDKRRMS